MIDGSFARAARRHLNLLVSAPIWPRIAAQSGADKAAKNRLRPLISAARAALEPPAAPGELSVFGAAKVWPRESSRLASAARARTMTRSAGAVFGAERVRRATQRRAFQPIAICPCSRGGRCSASGERRERDRGEARRPAYYRGPTVAPTLGRSSASLRAHLASSSAQWPPPSPFLSRLPLLLLSLLPRAAAAGAHSVAFAGACIGGGGGSSSVAAEGRRDLEWAEKWLRLLIMSTRRRLPVELAHIWRQHLGASPARSEKKKKKRKK